MSAPDPRCALVVLTHERRDEAERAVAHARALPERPELIVVDNGSRDGTAQRLAARWPDLAIVPSPRNLGAAGRNLGVAATRRPYVAFADDDVAWAPGALGRAADVLDREPSLALVTARVLVGAEGREDPTCTRMAASPLPQVPGAAGVPVAGFLAGACMVRRAAFAAAGGYEPRLFLGGEEALLAIDLLVAGWRLAYVPEVVVHHFPSAQRDAAGRARALRRNAIRVAWLRRPAGRALAVTHGGWRHAASGGERLALAGDLLRSLPWLWRARRPVPAAVERALRAVERAGPASRPRGRSPDTAGPPGVATWAHEPVPRTPP